MKNMFPLCKTDKPTGARGLTSRMNSLANEVKLSHREPLDYTTKTTDFHTDSHQKSHYNIIIFMQDIALVI